MDRPPTAVPEDPAIRIHDSGRFVDRDLRDEILIYDRRDDRVHLLNATAREIYLLCDGRRPPSEIVRELRERYRDTDPDEIARDVRETVERLVALGLVSRN